MVISGSGVKIVTTGDEKACKEWEYFLGGKSGRTEFCPS
jgi:hypothetical protein